MSTTIYKFSCRSNCQPDRTETLHSCGTFMRNVRMRRLDPFCSTGAVEAVRARRLAADRRRLARRPLGAPIGSSPEAALRPLDTALGAGPIGSRPGFARWRNPKRVGLVGDPSGFVAMTEAGAKI